MKGLRKRISWQIGTWFFILALLPLASGALIIRSITYNLIVKESTSHLVDILDEKKKEVEDYVGGSKQVVKTLAQVPVVSQALQESSRVLVDARPAPLRKWMGAALGFLENTRELLDYHDILLINQKGDIVYSVAQEGGMGTNLRQEPYQKSGLAEVFEQSISQLTCEISQFIYYPPSGKSAAFIAAPVLHKNTLLGVLAVQLNEDHLFYIFTNYLGLGKSGEVLAAKRQADGSIVVAGPLRNRPHALEKGMDFSQYDEIPLLQAVNGEQAAGLAVDYRKRKIVAAWGFLPSLNWGMVVKIDQDEAFSSLRRQDFLIALSLLISLLFVVIGTLLATRQITGPIKKLTATMKKFASGDFKERVEVGRWDEMSMLSEAFNGMALEINNYKILKEKVQKEIEEKVLELQAAQERLKESEYKNTAILERSIEGFWTMNQAGCILEVNESFCTMLGYSRDALLGMTVAHLDANESKNVIEEYIKRTVQVGHELMARP